MPDNITHKKTTDTRTIPNRMTNPCQMVNFDRFMLLADVKVFQREDSGVRLHCPHRWGIIG
jgi:hypothetical protein